MFKQSSDRTLWRLVGRLVRLSIEIGLHHNPLPLIATGKLTGDECQLRIRLWSIVMSIDRETSIISGRPLSISPSDIDTPSPSALDSIFPTDTSPYFISSHFIAQIQADVVKVSYTSSFQEANLKEEFLGTLLGQINNFNSGLPQIYTSFFGVASIERKSASSLTADQALSLSKLSLTRILLLRIFFNSETVSYNIRRRSLWDGEVYALF